MKLNYITFGILFFSNPIYSQIQLDQSNMGANPTYSIVDNWQSRFQTFEAGMSGTLDQVKVDIEVQNCPYALICKVIDGMPDGTELTNELSLIPINTSRSIYTFNFDTPANLISGNTYTIGLFANCINGPGLSILWYKSVADSYDFGQAYYSFGSTYTSEDTLNDFYFETYVTPAVGYPEISKNDVKVFPNPANEMINIENLETNNNKYFLFDSWGRIILSGVIANRGNIAANNLENGFYLLQIDNGINLVNYSIVIRH